MKKLIETGQVFFYWSVAMLMTVAALYLLILTSLAIPLGF